MMNNQDGYELMESFNDAQREHVGKELRKLVKKVANYRQRIISPQSDHFVSANLCVAASQYNHHELAATLESELVRDEFDGQLDTLIALFPVDPTKTQAPNGYFIESAIYAPMVKLESGVLVSEFTSRTTGLEGVPVQYDDVLWGGDLYSDL